MKNIIKLLLKGSALFAFLILSISPNQSSAFFTTNLVQKSTAPSSLVATPKDSSVLIQWNNQTQAQDHVIEYKTSSSSNWINFEPVNPQSEGITVDGLVNGTSYDFRVANVSETGIQSEFSEVFNITPQENLDFNSNNQIISTGQSNSTGTGAFPILSTVQPFNNRMLNSSFNAFIPLIEPATNSSYPALGETMSSALGTMLTFLAMMDGVPDYSTIISLNGVPGASYSNLMQGTSPYNNSLIQVEAAKNLSLDEGKTLVVPIVTTIHGETDEINGMTPGEYEQVLVEWQSDYENDIKAITGQKQDIPLFIDQMSSWTSFGFTTPRVAIGQYNAAKNNPDKIIMVTPRYIFDSADSISHMTNYSQRRLGEYYAKVYKKVIIDKEEWKPLMPENITISGNVITAEFHVPVPPLTFDTLLVYGNQNMGFEYFDENNSATITNVAITGPSTVTITLSNTPTGQNKRLRYAYTGVAYSWTGRTMWGAARGNLRDSDMTMAIHSGAPMGNYLHNWALTFDEPIEQDVVEVAPSQPINVSATVGQVNGTAVVSFTPPTNTGTSPITSYIVTSFPGGITATGTGSPITITGLSNHTTYTFTVTAVSDVGPSTPSTNSNPVTISWYNVIIKPQMPASVSSVNNGKLPKPTSTKNRINESSKSETIGEKVRVEEKTIEIKELRNR
jgi:hypothetical protein